MASLAALVAAPAGLRGSEVDCAQNPVRADQVRTTADVEAFVRCAHEFLLEAGPAAAKEAFHDDPRWRSGEIYVFATAFDTTNVLSPPDRDLEGQQWGPVVDIFHTDLFEELDRVAIEFDQGWVYYAFRNPITGIPEPKASYIVKADWDGVEVHLGSGIYLRDVPGTCRPAEVSAARLEAEPSDQTLREFVNCAALELERGGYFAGPVLARDPRWRHGSTYVFGIRADTGEIDFSGSETGPERSGHISDLFEGRDAVAMTDAFGEAFWYYDHDDPATGTTVRKVSYVKRVVAQGVPLLVGSGYYASAP